MRWRTVRARLTLSYTAVFGGLLLLFGATAFVLLDRGLRANLDDSLASVARAVAASSRQSGGRSVTNRGVSWLPMYGDMIDPFGYSQPLACDQ